jgi:glycerol kinase
MARYILSIDQGTTGSTVMVFDDRGKVRGRAYSEFTQHYPKPAWVEHDAEEIWSVTHKLIGKACRAAKIKPAKLSAIGITNQRETVVVWDRKTGKPIHRAIVWQDRRTAGVCEKLEAAGLGSEIRRKTGLVIDPYFSGTKLAWILDNVRGARAKARRGELAFGTIDTWLIWKLSGGESHVTDYTNASRTLVYNIRKRGWDTGLCEAIDVEPEVLPEVCRSSGVLAETAPGVVGPGRIPISGVAGDQQAALFGQACFKPGMVKNTYGTGCFMLTYAGDKYVASKNRLLTTLACSADGKPAYALEGSVFIAGAAVQWLRDGLGLLKTAAESEKRARNVDSTLGCYLVPAFAGLGAPHWDAEARGALVGLTRGVTADHIIRATLESLAYQSRDILAAMSGDTGKKARVLRVDGGATQNDFLMQFQADLLGIPVDRPQIVESTAAGAAYLAGMGVGIWKTGRDVESARKSEKVFKPKMKAAERRRLCEGWAEAVERVRSRAV